MTIIFIIVFAIGLASGLSFLIFKQAEASNTKITNKDVIFGAVLWVFSLAIIPWFIFHIPAVIHNLALIGTMLILLYLKNKYSTWFHSPSKIFYETKRTETTEQDPGGKTESHQA